MSVRDSSRGLGCSLTLAQLQRPRLDVSVGSSSSRWKGVLGRTPVAGIYKYNLLWGKNPVKYAGHPMVAILAIGFVSLESCWGHLQSRSLGTVVTPTVLLILVALYFLPCS